MIHHRLGSTIRILTPQKNCKEVKTIDPRDDEGCDQALAVRCLFVSDRVNTITDRSLSRSKIAETPMLQASPELLRGNRKFDTSRKMVTERENRERIKRKTNGRSETSRRKHIE